MKFNCSMHGFIFLTVLAIGCSQKHYTGPLTPEQALKSFQLDSNFEIRLYASEPFVRDPVSMVFDEKGNVYAVEMPDYPYAPEPGKEQGRIKVLLDTNRDGRVDRAIVFADSLSEATTVLPWKGGVIVTAAPRILYLKDTDGDFRADIREVLYTGFFKGNSEGQITALRYSIDNWIYAANMGFESHVKPANSTDTTSLSLIGTDFRFNISTGGYEPATGTAQFGQAIDDWGHRFITENSWHIKEAVIPWRYLHRNPFLSISDVVEDISDHEQEIFQVTAAPYWRKERTRRRNEQYQKQHLKRIEYADKHFTGAAGGIIYGGDKFPMDFRGNYFVVDVAGNILHRDVLSRADSSPTYRATRDDFGKNHEFLSSTDPWFRPVNLSVGPDGYLYVIDMYRQHIETPFAIDEDLKKDMDFTNGTLLGRIYRIVPKNAGRSGTIPDTKGFMSKDWVSLLQNPNREWRLQAQRRLIELHDTSVRSSLLTLSRSASAQVRLHALYTMEGLGLLTIPVIGQALDDKEPGIVEAALVMAERYPQLLSRIVKKAQDPVAGIALQAVLSMGGSSANEIGSALHAVLEKHSANKWFRKAVLCSEAGSSVTFLQTVGLDPGFFASGRQGDVSFIQEFSEIIAARNNPGEVKQVLEYFNGLKGDHRNVWIRAALAGMNDGIAGTGGQMPDQETLSLLDRMENDPADSEIRTIALSLKQKLSDNK